MKKLLLTFVSFALCMMVNAGVIASGICGRPYYSDNGPIVSSDVKWTLTDDYTLTISGEGEMKGYSEKPVGLDYYSYAKDVKKVVIGEGVKSIGEEAFKDFTELTSVDMSKSSLTCIGASAFYNCTKLTSILFCSQLTRIDGAAFMRCSGMTSLVLPNSVTEIGNQAFYGCSGLKKMYIPSSVRSSGEEAFGGISSNCVVYADMETNITRELKGFGCTVIIGEYDDSDQPSDEEDQWVDVTDECVVNPRFDGGDIYTGWSGSSYGAYNGKENAEHYDKVFNSYQTISGLTPGKYRVSVQAFYRAGTAANDYNIWSSDDEDGKVVMLYANSEIDEEESSVCQAASGAADEWLGGDCSFNGEGYIPNNMVAADAWFTAGYYNNSVEVMVGDDGNLTIGIKKYSVKQGDWVCLDNWKLEKCVTPAKSEWIDMTNDYVTNPCFDGGDIYTGWNGSSFGAYNGKENAEHFNRNFDSYQELTGLAPGKYRVSVQAFYRAGDASNDYDLYSNYPEYGRNALLYAYSSDDNQETAICQAASGTSDERLGGDCSFNGEGYIPNNMVAADAWFNAGYYNNSVEVVVGADGILTIGIKKYTTIGNDWVCLDNWKLEFLSESGSGIVHPESVSLDCNQKTIGYKEEFKLNAIILPHNAIVKRVEWSSSNPGIVSVDKDGNVRGLGVGTAIITATTKDGGYTAQCEVSVQVTSPTVGSILINEVMVANIDMFIDPSWNYGGWIELYNPTDTPIHMGNCWISDNADSLKMAHMNMEVGSVPAHGFLNLWFDHTGTRKDIGEGWVNTQLGVDLDADGGSLYISDPNGVLICSVDYPASIKRTSYARKTDGGSDWGVTSNPTPAASNSTSQFAVEQLAMPVVDTDGQVFSGSLDINVTFPSGATLIYTTDGSTPTLQNGNESADGHFSVYDNAVYRFRLFQDGYLPSDVVTRTYLYNNRNYYLPVVSVVTDAKNLYDDEIGVYVTGTNGKTANQDWTKRNFNMDWDRPVNFEYMVDGQEVYNQETAFSISGGWSRKYEPRSFKLKAKKEYGLKDLQYPFFSDKMYNKSKSLLFRNGGNDLYNLYRMKDASLQAIARESGFRLNLQSYQPTHVFINGEYFAMLNMREPSNKHYGYSNYGIGTDNIDAFEMSVDSGYVQKDGTRDAFEQWYKLADLSTDPMIYQQICDIVDVDDYCNYMAFKFFLNDWDWPHNNMKAFKSRNDGKFHFVIFDLDNCVDRVGNNIFSDFEGARIKNFYSRPEYNNTYITAEVEMVTIFLNMINNEEFRKKFIDTYCMVGGTIFADEDKNAEIINGLAANIEEALRWERGYSPFGYSKEQAGGIINAISNGYKERMIDVIKSYGRFNLYDIDAQPTTIASSVPEAKILLNGMEVPKNNFNGYTFAPVTLKAEAPAGYKFVGWQKNGGVEVETNDIFTKQQNWQFYDKGSLDGYDWTSDSYTETNWTTAQAPFGFGKAGKPMSTATTEVGTSGNRPYTTYFRKVVDLDYEPSDDDVFTVNISVDDGYLAYVNGQEVSSYHVYSGSDYYTLTQDLNGSWYEADDPHEGTFDIPGSLMHQGQNIIAIEVHQCTATSSDFWFDASLKAKKVSYSNNAMIVSTDPVYSLPSYGENNLVAMFEKADAATLAVNRVTPVKINEVSASNDVHVNEFYKKNDWLELYNTTSSPIDVAGMYISDNVDNPHKYQFVKQEGVNTIIPAHGHLVVWCDKLAAKSQIHTSFKLAAEGGTLIISAEDDSWSDMLNYCEHRDDESVGLYPDGGTMCYIMHRTTIGRTNTITSYDASHEQIFPSIYKQEDVNCDGSVDTQDVLSIYQFMQDAGTVTAKTREDLNNDGVVDTQDVLNLYDYIQNH